jgi:hypothetical protein
VRALVGQPLRMETGQYFRIGIMIITDSDSSSGIERNVVNTTTLAGMAADPVKARALQALQIRACDHLSRLVDHVAQSLSAHHASLPQPDMAPVKPDTMSSFVLDARQREFAARARRKLAEEMVMAALRNLHNPNWNPADPQTGAIHNDGALLALVQMSQP